MTSTCDTDDFRIQRFVDAKFHVYPQMIEESLPWAKAVWFIFSRIAPLDSTRWSNAS
jgi:uncharacterized protein (DUF1810 family)